MDPHATVFIEQTQISSLGCVCARLCLCWAAHACVGYQVCFVGSRKSHSPGQNAVYSTVQLEKSLAGQRVGPVILHGHLYPSSVNNTHHCGLPSSELDTLKDKVFRHNSEKNLVNPITVILYVILHTLPRYKYSF